MAAAARNQGDELDGELCLLFVPVLCPEIGKTKPILGLSDGPKIANFRTAAPRTSPHEQSETMHFPPLIGDAQDRKAT